ncbi:MAG: cytochrome c, partial [Steroidobacteraceae bacterium]
PLAQSEWVNGKPDTLVAIVLNGVAGEITVLSQKYNGMMPPFKDQLSDAELAALLTHIRSSWGNNSPPVTADSVSAVREKTNGRAPFQGEAELATLD